MKGLTLILFGIFLLLVSCEEEEPVKYKGIVIFSTEPGGASFTHGLGFSFEEGKNIVCADLNCSQADIKAVNLILQNVIEEIYLTSPENNDAFYLNGSFGSEAEAITYFNGYNEVTATDFTFATSALEANQVWTFQSIDMKYAKIRIIEITLFPDATYQYSEIKVEYEYQPGGGRTFSR